ncbi:putative sugar phosphate/phosphate translocator [Iris pallida]|uniref:Sugar phosphate/phosphate translocator n=1 Tax=Iris pallida TaxID=29817 RepID=A0AAX6G5F6_IRIPA|nr:putative sugar phosphate/phosphate translocator [Iris pallida]
MADSIPIPNQETEDPDREQPDEVESSIRKEPSFSQWCSENEAPTVAAGDAGSTVEGAAAAEEIDLPLLWGPGHGERGISDAESPRSSEFRQRGMNGKAYVPMDVEYGIRSSQSTEKLDLLGSSSSSSQKKPFSAAMVMKTLFFVLVWYTFSTSLTLYNKTLLGDELGKFPAPLLMNTVHFAMQAVVSNAIIYIQSRCSESSDGPIMTWRDYFLKVVPTAIGTALDINLSNASLVFITVTFATMCKSASPIFLLVFAFAFRLETPSVKLLGIILVISVGVLLTVAKETQFEFWGFLFVMLAAVMSGFRWSMTQILLQKESYGLKNPITLMSYVTPVMTVATAISSLLMDPWSTLKDDKYFNSSKHIINSCLLMFLGGTLAFFMVLTEYILVSATSAVTVTVAGIVKEAVTILVAVFYFHDQFTVLKGIGLLTIMLGVSLFNWYKYEKLHRPHPSDNREANSTTATGAAKYVILDEMDTLDNDT